MKIVINEAYGPFNISKEFFDYYKIPYTEIYGSTQPLEKNFNPRKDIRLIEFIELFGSKRASKGYSNLVVKDIPKGSIYRIDEYDGYEAIEYRDITEWEIAD